MAVKLTIRVVDALEATGKAYFVWDSVVSGFGVAVSSSGVKSYVVKYRVGKGRAAITRRMTLGKVNVSPVDEAREKARKIIAKGNDEKDVVAERKANAEISTIKQLADKFLKQHAHAKRKASTAAYYELMIAKHIVPALGTKRANQITRAEISNWHAAFDTKHVTANRALTILRAMYAFGHKHGYVPEDVNPTRHIDKNPEEGKERYLTKDELQQLGEALRLAETTGLPWVMDTDKPTAKHIPKKIQSTTLDPYAVAAIRLLIFTGARLREILHLKWDYVDVQRGLLFLPDSKTGKKTIVLSPPALAILAALPRVEKCPFVIVGKSIDKPRADLKRPWDSIKTHAGLTDVRLHDLRHTYASYGAGAGLGLPIVGKLLGHAQSSTTERYAHLDNDPLKRGASIIGGEIAAAMGETQHTAEIIPLKAKS